MGGEIRYTLPWKEKGRADYIAYTLQGRVIPRTKPIKNKGIIASIDKENQYRQVIYATKFTCPQGLYFDTQNCYCNYPEFIYGGPTTPVFWEVLFEDRDTPEYFLDALNDGNSYQDYDPEAAVVVAFPEYNYYGPNFNPYFILNPNYDPNYNFNGIGGSNGSVGGNQQNDCYGIAGGGAYIDNCGVCVGGYTGKTPCIEIIDNIKIDYTCVSDIITKIISQEKMSVLFSPFIQQTNYPTPNLTFNHKNMIWGVGDQYLYGTASSNLSEYNRDVEITLNTKMINQSSELLVAATIIHESLHAYIYYYIKTTRDSSGYIRQTGESVEDSWIKDALILTKMEHSSKPSRDHHLAMMINEILPKVTNSLSDLLGTKYTQKDYILAAMIGLNNAGNLSGDINVTQGDIDLVDQIFQNVLNLNGLTKSDFNTFIIKHNNYNNKKVSCAK